MSLNYVEITGTFDDGTGSPLSGLATFTPNVTVYASGIPVLTPDDPIQAQIIAGQLKGPSGGNLQLLATDNDGLTYLGQTGFLFYTVAVQIAGQALDPWSFFLPFGTLGAGPVDLYSLANTGAGGGGGGGGFANPMTTLGDLIDGTTSGTAQRLAGNASATRKFLRSAGTGSAANAPAWDTLQSGDIPSLPYDASGAAAAAQAAAEAASVPAASVGAASGVASLDSGGHVPAGQLPAATSGAQGAVELTGDLGGTASSPQVTGTHLAAPLPVAQGGTGQATQQAAIDALTGTQVAGRVLRSDGTHATLSSIQASDLPAATGGAQGAVELTGDLGGTASSPQVTGTHLASPLPTTQGGTGQNAANVAALLVALGAAALAGAAFSGEVTVPAPVNPSDAVTKSYADAIAQGLAVKPSVQEATAAALPSNTYANGASGVGATLTATANGALVVDGITAAVNDRVLVQNEATASHNGIYLVTQAGSGAAPYILTRAADMNTAAQVPGAFCFCEQGTANAGAGFTVASAGPFTIGTTAITWTQFSGAGEISAGTGLAKSGNTLSVENGGVLTPAHGGTGQATLQAAINALAGAVTSGQFLRGDGTNVVLAAIGAGDVPTLNQNTTGTAANFTGGATLPAYLAPKAVALTFGVTIAVDASLGNAFNLTLTASTGTIANPTNPVDGEVIRFRISQDATGGRTLAYGTAYDFGAGVAPTLSTGASKVDIIAFEYVASLAKWCYLGAAIPQGF